MISPARRRPPMPPDEEGDHEVGYRKPPRHTRFTKGQSGNPRGRPPGAKNLKTLLSDALNQLVNRSASADFRAIKILLDMVRDIEGQTEPASAETSPFSEADEKVIEQLK